NIRDIRQDTIGGRRTMAILVGRPAAINVLLSLFAGSYVWIIGLVVLQFISPWALLVFISVPVPKRSIDTFRRSENPLEVAPAMKATAQTNTFFVILLGIGLIIGHFL